MESRIAIVGAGDVGATAAYALLLRSVCREIIFVDVKIELRNGQVRDLINASDCEQTGTRIRAGTYKEASQCDIIIITAGSKRSLGETNLELIYRNTSMMHNIIQAMKPLRSDAILLVVSNPVDVLTYFAQRLSGLPTSQVIGCGTYLDTIRLRGLLADQLQVATKSIDAYVLGESGKSQFVAWSVASIGGVPIDEALPSGALDHNKVAEEYRVESQLIVQEKGHVAFGIGSLVSHICSSILFDKHNVCPISHFIPEFGCCLSLLVVLGRKGIERTIEVPLSSTERVQLTHSAKSLKELIDSISGDFK